MSTTITFPYTTPGNYTFDSSKIEVTGGVAKLKLATSNALTFNEDFANDTGFTYDSDEVEFSGGAVQQKDQADADAILGINYNSDQNANWATSGSLTGSLRGSASVSGGKLVCTGAVSAGAQYDNANIASNITTEGAFKFIYTPNYSTSPSTNVNMIMLENPTAGGGANVADRVSLSHSPSGSGTLRMWVTDNTGANVYLATTVGAAWQPTSGVEYEIEVNWSASTGDIRIFIDGALHGLLNSAGSWTRGTSASRLSVGATSEVYDTADASFHDVILYDAVQHTAAYTAGYTAPDFKYVETSATLPAFDHNASNQGEIISMDAFTSTDTNSPKYTVKVGTGNFQYWNGSAWADSDGTFAQSSTESDINTNISALTAVDGETSVQLKVHFDDKTIDADQMSATDLTITYTGETSYPTDNPTIVANSIFKSTGLEDFSATETKSGSDEIKYIMTVGAQDRYVTGGSAANSDGSYAQSSTAAEMDSDIEGIVSARSTVALKAFLHSDDGTTTPELDLVSILYNAALSDPTLPTLVEVEGFIYDANGPVASQEVKVRPFEAGYFNQGIFHKYVYDVIATTDADGFFEGSCYVQGSGKFWDFKIGSQAYKVALLDKSEMDLKDATTFEVIET